MVSTFYYDLNISIHALRGEGDAYWYSESADEFISIHALRGEGDDGYPKEISDILKFQSTPSVGRATKGKTAEAAQKTISIHALRGEGDNGRGSVHT